MILTTPEVNLFGVSPSRSREKGVNRRSADRRELRVDLHGRRPGGQVRGLLVRAPGAVPDRRRIRLAKLTKLLIAFFAKISKNFGGLVLRCIKTKFCKKICV